ncbi:hypothetical protein K8I61_08165 [bacterium]|nr:hypothetical protein [bacterium]
MRPNRNPLRFAVAAALLSAVAILGCNPGDGEDDEDSAPGLVLALSFEDARDVALSGGTLTATDPEEAFTRGIDGNGFWMSEGNVIALPALGRVPPAAGTIEFWILPKAVWHDGLSRRLLTIGGQENFSIVKDAQKSFLNFILHGEALGFPVDEDLIEYWGFTFYRPELWTTGWTHVAITWDGVGERTDEAVRRVYLNGLLRNELVDRMPSFSVDAPLIIGALADEQAADAIIDELRIYSRALSADEIRARGDIAKYRLIHELPIIPTPSPYGVKDEPDFEIDGQTRIAVAPEWIERLDPLLARLQDAIEDATGFSPAIVASNTVGEIANVIAVGTTGNNHVLREIARDRKLAVNTTNLRAGGYALEVFENAVAVAGVSYAGTVHGLGSLIRAARHLPAAWPPVTISDRADFPMRATELPGTGGAATDEVLRRLAYLSELKLTHVLLPGDFYFDLDNGFVRDDAIALFAAVRDFGMEPVPQLPLYSNAARVVAECNARGFDCEEGATGDTCPLVEDMYEDILRPVFENIAAHLEPRAIHIGHDDVRGFNLNPVCAGSGQAPSELFAYSVHRIVGLIEDTSPGAQIMAWADMILPTQNAGRLNVSPPGSDREPPDVLTLVPTDIVWNVYLDTNFAAGLYFFGTGSFGALAEAGVTQYTAGPTGPGTTQSFIWMRTAFENDALGFVGRPQTDDGFENDLWNWLPAAAEHAWTYWAPGDPTAINYDYDALNNAYGSY